jgi:hypothetical protein
MKADDDAAKAFAAMLGTRPTPVERLLAMGVSAHYVDKEGRIVEELPDGSIYRIAVSEDGEPTRHERIRLPSPRERPS